MSAEATKDPVTELSDKTADELDNVNRDTVNRDFEQDKANTIKHHTEKVLGVPNDRAPEKATGVTAAPDMQSKAVGKEMTEAITEEIATQTDCEQSMTALAGKRTSDERTMSPSTSAEKGLSRADAEAELQAHESHKAAGGEESTAAVERISSLRLECDWLSQCFEMREIGSLTRDAMITDLYLNQTLLPAMNQLIEQRRQQQTSAERAEAAEQEAESKYLSDQASPKLDIAIDNEMESMPVKVCWEKDLIEKSTHSMPITSWMRDDLLKKSDDMAWRKDTSVKTKKKRVVGGASLT